MFSLGGFNGSNNSERHGSNDQDGEYRNGGDEPQIQG